MEYRTEEQFNDICEDMINGNWTDAGKNCAKYGFYANDLKNAYSEYCGIEDIWDFVELIEIADRYR